MTVFRNEAAAPTLPSGVRLIDDPDGQPIVTIDGPTACARVHLQGAQVTSWTPTGSADVLWRTPQAHPGDGQAYRGGIPLIAPWFGPGRRKDKPFAHGWFRTASWTLDGAETDGPDVLLRLSLDGATAAVPAGQPADLRGELTVRIGARLSLDLTITAGADPVEIEDALHAYLAVSNVEEIDIVGLDGTRYADKAPGGRLVNAQQGDLRLNRLTDRVYAHNGAVEIVDEGAGRRIRVDKTGSGSTIVWNPWSTRAAEMPDVGEQWRRFVCVEPGNALNQHIKLAAGEAHTLSAVFEVVPV